jgi:LmbE family N-acetylglucosaminyl deacetylase
VSRTVVFFHAHPDDEATAGEAGLAADHLRGDGQLGDRRRAELGASAAAVGVRRLELLGYADSGLAQEPTPTPPAGRPPRFADAEVGEAAQRLAQILIEENASVLTSYDRNGGYGHPDHLAVHRVGAAAALSAGTPVLLEATVPRDRLLAAARAVNRLLPPSRRVDLQPWTNAYTAAAEITHCIDVRAQAGARRASMRAHASQATANAGPRTLEVFTRIPAPLFGLVFGREWYRLGGSNVVRPAAGTRFASVFDTLRS